MHFDTVIFVIISMCSIGQLHPGGVTLVASAYGINHNLYYSEYMVDVHIIVRRDVFVLHAACR